MYSASRSRLDEPNAHILMANPLGLKITALLRVHHHSKGLGAQTRTGAPSFSIGVPNLFNFWAVLEAENV